MTDLVVLAAILFTRLADAPARPGPAGSVFITTTVVALPGGPSNAAAADGDAVFMGLGVSIVQLDLDLQPPAARPVARLDADVAALAVDSARVWAGDGRGRLHAFERRPNGTLAAAGALDLAPDDGASAAIGHIVLDGPRAFVTVVGTGLVVVDVAAGGLIVHGTVDRRDVAPLFGALDGAAFARFGRTVTRVDARVGGDLRRDAVTLSFDPEGVHHDLWEPQLLAVDPVQRQLIAVGGVAGWAGRPCACEAIAFDLASPLAPREAGHGAARYVTAEHLALGSDWAYLVSDDRWDAVPMPSWTLTALNRGRGRLEPQVWWQGTEAIGAPAPLADGGVVLPIRSGGFMVLTPYVDGRVWLPIGWR